MSLSAPPRPTRFRQTSSPLRLENIAEKHKPVDEHVPGSKLTMSPGVESDSGSRPSPRPSLHRTSKPLPSILKRKAQTIEERDDEFHSAEESGNRFEISVIRYRTSCCKSIVSMEHISDWIHETASNVHRCPSCMLPCILNPLCTPTPSHPQTLLPATVSLGPKIEHVLSLAREILQQQYAKMKLALPSPPPRRVGQTYRLFDTDDETYPETDFTRVLSSSLFTTDIQEASMRLLNIAGLTLVLLALLSQ